MEKNVQPNILFVFADQLSMQALSIYGCPNPVNTPNISYLAEHGVKFTSSYCSSPQCSPSRSSILTGLYPHKTSVVGNVDTPGTKDLNPNINTIGAYFKKHGYRTGYVGKWHLGAYSDGFGFDYCKIHNGGKAHEDDKVTEHFFEFIDEKCLNPWITFISYENPHDIYEINNWIKSGGDLSTHDLTLPFSVQDDLSEKPAAQSLFRDGDQGKAARNFNEVEWKNYLSFYYLLVEKVDEELGRIIKKLETAGQYENTVIIFSSDHGDLMGAHRCAFKGPMMYEELMKVPLIFSCPALLPANEKREQFTVNVDLFPTMCDLAGIDIPEGLDGISIKDCIFSSQEKSRDVVFAEYYSKQKWVNPIRTIIGIRFKYNLYLSGEEELYDLRQDANETINLAGNADYYMEKEKLKYMLLSRIKETDDPFFEYTNTDQEGNNILPGVEMKGALK